MDDKEQIQHDVQACGKYEKEQRNLAVANCSQISGKQVIKNICRNADADDHDISVCILKNIIRRVHKFQKRFHDHETEYRQYNGRKNGQKDTVGCTAFYALYILSAIFLRNQDRKSGSDSLGKTDDQKHDRTGGTDSSQCICAYITADDNRIYHIIKLLKDISDDKWNRKF